MSVAIGTYISFETRTGAQTGNNYQNFHRGQTRNYNGRGYLYGAFGFSGAAVDIDGANIQAQLVFGVNQLILQIAQTAADSLYVVRVNTVWLNPDNFDETSTRLEEVYSINGFDHDTSRLTFRLGSPLDAIDQNVPRRVLTRAMVGALPSTGNISFV